MSALKEPDDGRRQERTVRDDNGIREVTQGHIRSRSFPVRFGAYGKPDAWAIEWTDTVTDDTFFLVHIPGLEDVRAEFPEHELTGPLPPDITARLNGQQPTTAREPEDSVPQGVAWKNQDRAWMERCPACEAYAGEPCHEPGNPERETHGLHIVRKRVVERKATERAAEKARIRSVLCPSCGAEAGKACVSKDGNKRQQFHTARTHAAVGVPAEVRAANYSVPCATCYAAVGEPCRPTGGGEPYEDGYVHKPREVLAGAAVISCPHCFAPAGEPCVSENGNTLRNVHVIRVRNSARRA